MANKLHNALTDVLFDTRNSTPLVYVVRYTRKSLLIVCDPIVVDIVVNALIRQLTNIHINVNPKGNAQIVALAKEQGEKEE